MPMSSSSALGWTGSILGIELAHEGLNVVALERGKYRDTSPDFTYPKAADELKYGVRGDCSGAFRWRPSPSAITSATPRCLTGNMTPSCCPIMSAGRACIGMVSFIARRRRISSSDPGSSNVTARISCPKT